MNSPFRYVEQNLSTSVTLHLFKTVNGTHRGDVRGPWARRADGAGQQAEMTLCVPLDEAFASGIRMANRNDVALVVSGDRSLWSPLWGRLGE